MYVVCIHIIIFLHVKPLMHTVKFGVFVICDFFSVYDQEATQHRAVSATYLAAERLLCDASTLNAQLQNLISRRVHSTEGIQHLMSLR